MIVFLSKLELPLQICGRAAAVDSRATSHMKECLYVREYSKTFGSLNSGRTYYTTRSGVHGRHLYDLL